MLEHWNRSTGDEIPARAEVLARVIGASFDIPSSRHANLVREISLTLGRPDFHAYVITVDGEPVATGQRYTFDGASYLSSIGTRPGWRGRGFGAYITRALAADSRAEGVDLVYLGVYADNTAGHPAVPAAGLRDPGRSVRRHAADPAVVRFQPRGRCRVILRTDGRPAARWVDSCAAGPAARAGTV